VLARLAGLAARRPWPTVLIAVGAVAAMLAIGGPTAGSLSTGGFVDTQAENARAADLLQHAAGVGPAPAFVALVRADGGPRSPATARRVAEVAAILRADPAVARVSTVQDGRPLIAKDGRTLAVQAFLRSNAEPPARAAAVRLERRLAGRPGVLLGGTAMVQHQVATIVKEDLIRAEMIAFPLLFLISLWVFRGVVAALLPPLIGGMVIVAGLIGLRLVNEVTDISAYALNLVTGLGLGLSIDACLLMVSRHREELARGPAEGAIGRTLGTAGRSVVFSSLTVAGAMSALLVFHQGFLRSMGLGGIMVALLSMVAAVVVLPPVLVILGPRINALAPRAWQRRTAEADAVDGFWHRLSRFVMRRPALVALAAGGALIAAGIPALGVRFITPDARVLPTSASARQVSDALRRDFAVDQTTPVFLAIRAPAGPATATRLARERARLAGLDGVRAVAPPVVVGPGVWRIDVFPSTEPLAGATQDLVGRIRAGPHAAPTLAGGLTAYLVDEKASLAARLPLALAIVALATLLVLFVMTGSALLPLKAVVMNVLTISATVGILVTVFQDGRFEGPLSYQSPGALDATQPILMAVLAFALATDYEVFLLSRIKEAHDAGLGTERAVAEGLQRTGRIVTAAAILFFVAVAAFASSRIVVVKELGLGTGLAVLIDATIVRALLVPALMALFGRWNWWAPEPLRRLHRRLVPAGGAR
jgi:uncharacterized membrane protein YdfJ with MMPL/SSD domain